MSRADEIAAQNAALTKEVADLKAQLKDLKSKFDEMEQEFEEQTMWVTALDSAGVDNWSGYDYATELYAEMQDELNRD